MPSGLTKRLQSSISLRIAFLFCVTFSIGLMAAFLIAFLQIRYTLEKSAREVLSSKFHETSAVLASGGVRGLREFLSEERNRILNAPYLIRLLNGEGETIYIKPSVQEKNFDFNRSFKMTGDPEKSLGWSSIAAIDDEDVFNLFTGKTGAQLYLQIGKSNEEHEEILGGILEVFGITGAFFILASSGLGFFYARRSLAPIRRLLSAIKGIENGDLSRRVEVTGAQDELRDLGETFNRMIARIEKLIQVMKESLDNVAHDIRTPLTRIRAVSEEAILSAQPGRYREALEECAESATDLSGLVDQLMSISEAEAGTLPLRYEKCDVQEMIADVAEVYEFVAQEKEISISTSCDPGLHWDLDRKRIKQAVANLLDNAIKFSFRKSSIEILATAQGHYLFIAVKDQGIGVPDSDLPRIWDRLFRGDKSRSTQGLGLGLSIVRSVVMAHGGRVDAVPNPEGGMTFSFLVPEIPKT